MDEHHFSMVVKEGGDTRAALAVAQERLEVFFFSTPTMWAGWNERWWRFMATTRVPTVAREILCSQKKSGHELFHTPRYPIVST